MMGSNDVNYLESTQRHVQPYQNRKRNFAPELNEVTNQVRSGERKEGLEKQGRVRMSGVYSGAEVFTLAESAGLTAASLSPQSKSEPLFRPRTKLSCLFFFFYPMTQFCGPVQTQTALNLT